MISDLDGGGVNPPRLITIEEQIRCAERELEKRRAFYPKWVATGRMRPAKADYEIAAMEAVVHTLKNTKQPMLL